MNNAVDREHKSKFIRANFSSAASGNPVVPRLSGGFLGAPSLCQGRSEPSGRGTNGGVVTLMCTDGGTRGEVCSVIGAGGDAVLRPGYS